MFTRRKIYGTQFRSYGVGENKNFLMESSIKHFAYEITTAQTKYYQRWTLPSMLSGNWIKHTYALELPSREWRMDSGWKFSQMASTIGRPHIQLWHQISATKNTPEVGQIATVMWLLWQRWNDWVFNHNFQSPSQLVQIAELEVQTF